MYFSSSWKIVIVAGVCDKGNRFSDRSSCWVYWYDELVSV